MKKTFFYYSKLSSPGERELYKAIIQSIREQKDTASAKNVSLRGEQVTNVLYAIRYDYPELFYVSLFDDCHYTPHANGDLDLKFVYLYPPDIQRKKIEETNRFIRYLMARIPEAVLPSEFLTALWLHDLLVSNVRYDHVARDSNSKDHPEAYSIEGGLMGKKAVCSGVAKLYMMLCERADIWCTYVTGTTVKTGGAAAKNSDEGKGGRHGWNLLRLDGEYAYADVTWDLQREDEEFISHTYFGMSDEQCFRKRTPDIPIPGVALPHCREPNPNNFYLYAHSYLRDLSELDRFFRRMLSQRKPCFEFQLSGRGAPTEHLYENIRSHIRGIMYDTDDVVRWSVTRNEQMYVFRYDVEYK